MVESPAARGGRPALSALKQRVACSRADLSPDSETFRAAVVLLCSRTVSQSVEKLALITGYPRQFVARCARRLVDNGVWRGTDTAVDDADCSEEVFWADVAVAEGKLIRQVDDRGEVQWAPPGAWWKDFDYVSRERAEVLTNTYHPAPDRPAGAMPLINGSVEEAESEAPPLESERREVRAAERMGRRTTLPSSTSVIGSPALFGHTVWLS